MTPYEKGLMGEEYVQAKAGIEAHTRNTGKLRPDFVSETKSVLIDSKNVASQSLTKQLIAYKNLGFNKTIIYVRLHTKITSALRNSGIIIKYFPW